MKEKIKCPACFNELSEIQVGRFSVDVCQGGCGGIWFDAFELQGVDEPDEAAGVHLLEIERDASLTVDTSRKRECPRCDGVKLMRHFISPKREVEVDECPNCGGYWLDAGELARIRAEKTHTETPQKSGVTPEVIRYLYRLQADRKP